MTTDQMLIAGIAGLGALVVLLLGFLLGGRGRNRGGVSLPPGAEALAPAFVELRNQIGDLTKMVNDIRVDTAGEDARRKQEDQAWDRLTRVETTLPTIQQSLQSQLAEALRDLGTIRELQAAERQRWSTEDNAFTELQRLTSVMLGSATAGAAAERMVDELLKALPAQWRIGNHSVNGKTVEFAVRLPDGQILPIDSKVVAQAELSTLKSATDNRQREGLKQDIQKKVLAKAGEVQKYVDARSVGFAIVAVSDATYAVSGPILPEAFQKHRALLVPYSLLAPFVLMIYEQHRHGGSVDAAQLTRLLGETQRHLMEASDILNSHLSGAITTLSNARDRLSRELAAAAVTLEQSRGSDGASSEQPQSKSA